MIILHEEGQVLKDTRLPPSPKKVAELHRKFFDEQYDSESSDDEP